VEKKNTRGIIDTNGINLKRVHVADPVNHGEHLAVARRYACAPPVQVHIHLNNLTTQKQKTKNKKQKTKNKKQKTKKKQKQKQNKKNITRNLFIPQYPTQAPIGCSLARSQRAELLGSEHL
jgi:hypothetical protein